MSHVKGWPLFPPHGDGGAIFTDDEELVDICRSIRVHGKGTHKYDNIRIGLNARLHTLQAAILLAKLDVFAEELEAKQKVAERYTELLNSQSAVPVPPFIPDGCKSAWAQYSILAKNSDQRGRIQAALKENAIPSAIYYPKPLHLQAAFASLGYESGDFPVAEEISEKIFSLPMHAYLEDREIERICKYLS